jgi:hypothetical protein
MTSRNIKIAVFKENIGLFPFLGYECPLFIQINHTKKKTLLGAGGGGAFS